MLFKQFKKYARSNLATFPLLWAAFCVTSTLAGWRRVQPPGPIHLWQRRCRHNHDWDEVKDHRLCLTKTLESHHLDSHFPVLFMLGCKEPIFSSLQEALEISYKPFFIQLTLKTLKTLPVVPVCRSHLSPSL